MINRATLSGDDAALPPFEVLILIRACAFLIPLLQIASAFLMNWGLVKAEGWSVAATERSAPSDPQPLASAAAKAQTIINAIGRENKMPP
jgi:hypothetical protein